jgi:hypothetical protein
LSEKKEKRKIFFLLIRLLFLFETQSTENRERKRGISQNRGKETNHCGVKQNRERYFSPIKQTALFLILPYILFCRCFYIDASQFKKNG